MMNDLFLFFFLFLFFLLLLFFFLFLFLFLFFFFWRFWFSGLFAWSFTEPFGQFGLWPFLPFIIFFLPQGLKLFSPDYFPAAFVQLSSVFVCSCVSSTFIFGVHADLWWILASKSFGVQAF